jgi:hypothetical protein
VGDRPRGVGKRTEVIKGHEILYSGLFSGTTATADGEDPLEARALCALCASSETKVLDSGRGVEVFLGRV